MRNFRSGACVCLIAMFGAVAIAQLAPPHRVNKTVQKPHRKHPFQPPHFSDSKSRALTYAMLKAERTLPPMRIKIAGEGSAPVIDWDFGNIRQDDADASWAYRSGVLTVACKKGYFRGAANHADVLDYLAALTSGADTLSRQLLLHEHPFEDFFPPDATVKIAGSARVKGDRADILQVSGRLFRGSLFVRRHDHLVLSVSADSLSPAGKVVYRESRTYTYKPISHPESVFQIAIKQGARVRPLPASAIKIGRFGSAG